VAALQASPHLSGNVLARLLSTKLSQRVAMVLLQQRLAPWRYTQASVQLAPAAAAEAAAEEEEEEDFEVAEEVEEVIEALLAGLQDRDTVVRWSAAKGVGRVTGCLPRELGDEVVESVLQLFRPTGG
jgi:HEAT repeat protein